MKGVKALKGSRVKGFASRGQLQYDSDQAADPRSLQFYFLKLKRREFGAGREMFIEFVFLLCENGLVPGSVARPTGRIQ
jgi:hypothetical protein